MHQNLSPLESMHFYFIMTLELRHHKVICPSVRAFLLTGKSKIVLVQVMKAHGEGAYSSRWRRFLLFALLHTRNDQLLRCDKSIILNKI